MYILYNLIRIYLVIILSEDCIILVIIIIIIIIIITITITKNYNL